MPTGATWCHWALTRPPSPPQSPLSLTQPPQMYVPGKLSDVEHVLVDVGTGYYVEKVPGGHGASGGTCPRVCAAETPMIPPLAPPTPLFAPFPLFPSFSRFPFSPPILTSPFFCPTSPPHSSSLFFLLCLFLPPLSSPPPFLASLRPPPQSADAARAFFKRKIDFLTRQMEKIQPALQEKHAMKQGQTPPLLPPATLRASTHSPACPPPAPCDPPFLSPASRGGNDEPEDPTAHGAGGSPGSHRQGIAPPHLTAAGGGTGRPPPHHCGERTGLPPPIPVPLSATHPVFVGCWCRINTTPRGGGS